MRIVERMVVNKIRFPSGGSCYLREGLVKKCRAFTPARIGWLGEYPCI